MLIEHSNGDSSLDGEEAQEMSRRPTHRRNHFQLSLPNFHDLSAKSSLNDDVDVFLRATLW